MEWSPYFYEARISWGTQVCVEHKGEHQWQWLDASEGFCDGNEFLQTVRALVATRLAEREQGA